MDSATSATAPGLRRAFPVLWRTGACVASAGLLAGSFPPFDSAEGVWCGLVPLLVLARYTGAVASFCWGWLAGLGFWAVNLWWFLRLGDTGVSLPVAVLAWLAIAAYAAVYIGGFAALVSEGFRLSSEPESWRGDAAPRRDASLPEPGEPLTWAGRFRRMLLLVWVPVCWVGMEWLRSNLFTGFPWSALGVSQFRFTAIIQVAEVGGVYAVSALIVLVNTSVTIMALRMADQWRCRQVTRFQAELAIALTVFTACLLWGRSAVQRELNSERKQERVRLALVQPAIPQLKKWDETFVDEITNRLDRDTRLAAILKPDLIIWPETAIPVWPGSTEADWKPFVESYVTGGVPLLAGVLEFELRKPDFEFACYNSSVLVNTNANVVGRYRKQHLVPFGEYIPTESWIPFLKRLAPLGFSCEPGGEAAVLKLDPPGFAFSALICFEDIFAGLSREAVRRGAGFLVNQTNDAWFDDTAAPVQHMSHAVFRCVENRVAMVRVANTGVSCYIDGTGLIQDMGLLRNSGWNLGQSGFVPSTLAVRPAGTEMTFYNRWGDLGFAVPCAVVCVGGLFLTVRRIRRRDPAQAAGC
jgi:apolipoprotein N-acyltransferase